MVGPGVKAMIQGKWWAEAQTLAIHLTGRHVGVKDRKEFGAQALGMGSPDSTHDHTGPPRGGPHLLPTPAAILL